MPRQYLSFAYGGNVADPWYSRKFGVAFGSIVGMLTENFAFCSCVGLAVGISVGTGIGSMIKKENKNKKQ